MRLPLPAASPRLALSVCLCLSAASLCAQQVRVFGQLVQDAAGFALAVPAVRLANVPAASASLLGELVEVNGTATAGWPAPAVAVASLAATPHRLELRGDNRVGRVLKLRVDSPTAASYYLLASLGLGFVPLDGLLPFASGSFLLDPAANVLLHAGPIQQSWEEPWTIPADPAFVGVVLHFQAAMLGPQPPFVYLNAATTTLRAP